jgi:hypothetical protein
MDGIIVKDECNELRIALLIKNLKEATMAKKKKTTKRKTAKKTKTKKSRK